MNYCEKCGTVIPSGQNECPNCGNQIAIDPVDKIAKVGGELKENALNALASCQDYTSDYDAADIQSSTKMCYLAYLWWLCLIPLAQCKTPYARFHINQGLVLAIASTILWLVGGFLNFLLGKVFLLGIIIDIINWIFRLVTFVYMAIGLINVSRGQAKDLPIIGVLRLLK